MPYRYLVGCPCCGAFTQPREAADEATARTDTEHHYGPVLDVVDWQDDRNNPIDMLIVPHE